MTAIRGRSIEISPTFFKELDEFASDLRKSASQVKWAVDKAMMGYAMVTLGAAQKLSRGPLDPQGNRGGALGNVPKPTGLAGGKGVWVSRPQFGSASAAWKIPVRRITEDYYNGWYMERVSPMTWMVSNHSREAWYIEMGINHTGTGLADSAGNRVRVRRPVMKMATMTAIEFGTGTRFALTEFLSYFKVSGSLFRSSTVQGNFAGSFPASGSTFIFGVAAS